MKILSGWCGNVRDGSRDQRNRDHPPGPGAVFPGTIELTRLA